MFIMQEVLVYILALFIKDIIQAFVYCFLVLGLWFNIQTLANSGLRIVIYYEKKQLN